MAGTIFEYDYGLNDLGSLGLWRWVNEISVGVHDLGNIDGISDRH